MQVFRGLPPARARTPCALTIGNFDGVHRGHQAMLALLTNEARHRQLPSCVVMFEPHPRDFFARRLNKPQLAPDRVSTLRDAVMELHRCGIDRVVVLRFDETLASMPAQNFIHHVLHQGLQARYVLVGDDFRYGAQRAGDYAFLDAQGAELGFEVARMMSYEVHGLRVSSSAVRSALSAGDLAQARLLLGRPFVLSGRTIHGAKLGRELGFRTLNLRLPYYRSAAMGIFVARVHGLTSQPLPAVASLGVRPTVEDAGRLLLEVHCLDWPSTLGTEGGYGKCVQVELTHKLHDERKYESLEALKAGIAQDVDDARRWHGEHGEHAQRG